MVNERGLVIDEKYYNNLDVEGFSQMLKDPSYCYKFYWLEAIVKLISANIAETTFNDIIDEMICNAWYTVLEYHVHLSGFLLGEPRDALELAVIKLQQLSNLRADADSASIKNEIRKYDNELREYKNRLTKNVPYRALSGFFNNAGQSVNWGRTCSIIEYARFFNIDVPLPYVFGDTVGLKREVVFTDEWIKLIKDNTVTILGWIQFEKVKWLQNNNPEVPSLVYKLAPMDEKMRKLSHVRDLWELILDQQTIMDVFNDTPIEKGRYDIDHFIPWSFVMNDELWNLMPMDSSLNSSKSNKLPDWNRFFGKYADNQFILYSMINDEEKTYIRSSFEKCYKDNLHSIWANKELYRRGNTKEEFFNILEKNMRPVYDSARRQGYVMW